MDKCLSFNFVHFSGIGWITVFLIKLILAHHPTSAYSRVTTSTFPYNNIVIIIIIIIDSILRRAVTYFHLLYAIFFIEIMSVNRVRYSL